MRIQAFECFVPERNDEMFFYSFSFLVVFYFLSVISFMMLFFDMSYASYLQFPYFFLDIFICFI